MTPERIKRFEDVLNKRQGNLAIVLEEVHDPHNIYAVMRTADATGIHNLYIIHSRMQFEIRQIQRKSASAYKWLNIHFFQDVASCMKIVLQNHKHIMGTELAGDSTSLFNLDLTSSVALVFGNEKMGISNTMKPFIHQNFNIPMMGMVKSLNISVAAAVTMYEVFRQRQLKGLYHQRSLSESEFNGTLEAWQKREIKKRP
jgi:tRNA (guanosine-2'-O-)-methyltransferase